MFQEMLLPSSEKMIMPHIFVGNMQTLTETIELTLIKLIGL